MARMAAAVLRLPYCSVLLLLLLVWNPTPTWARWATLSGNAPVIIANGGTSGLYPDQTFGAYVDALNYSLPGVVLSCDLQMCPSLQPVFAATGTGICRTGLDLEYSTSIFQVAPQLNSTYDIDGKPAFGYYAIDIPYENLTTLAPARQSNGARTDAYDNAFNIFKPEEVAGLVNNTPSTWWLNSEYTTFIEKNSQFNATLYLQEAILQLNPRYVSVPEIALLRKLRTAANATGCKLIYKFLDSAMADASTNQTYDSLLGNLTFMRTLASGILIPKSLVWPLTTDSFYTQPTTLVEDAHRARLEVYVYDFANDQIPAGDPLQTSYNTTFDPVTEILYFIERYNFSVDGLFTDFPTTASEAIACYAANSRNGTAQNKEANGGKKTIISHNGASGVYPGGTTAAYDSAVDAGVDYIDCTVQLSLDGVPFCRTTINLVETTTVANSPLFQQYQKTYPEFGQGVFSFDLTWAQISTLASVMYSPGGRDAIIRDQSYNGLFGILSLADFLSIAKNHSVGALIDLQNAAYLREQHNLAVVDAVADVLSTSGYNSTDMVLMQSDESAALARLMELNVTYPRMYLVAWTAPLESPVSLTPDDFVEIKKYASSVNLFARLVEPYDSNFFLKGPPTDLISLAHAQNLTTYFQMHRNEFLAFAFDLRADTTLQLYSLVNYGIDGIVTDFPDTVAKYFDNQCLNGGLLSSTLNFSIPLVVPGVLSNETFLLPSPSPAPAPDLVVPESPLTGVAYVPSPGPSPSPLPSAACHTAPFLLFLAMVNIVLHLLTMA